MMLAKRCGMIALYLVIVAVVASPRANIKDWSVRLMLLVLSALSMLLGNWEL